MGPYLNHWINAISRRGGGGTERQSLIEFPLEIVTEVLMHLWHLAVTQVAAAGLSRNRLGTFHEEGHKVWDWRIQEDAGRLYSCNGDTIDVMQHVCQGQYSTPQQS